MKTGCTVLAVMLILFTTSCSPPNTDKLVSKAQQIYEAGDQQAAQKLYLKAMNLGNAEAYFSLAYRYTPPEKEKSIYYFSEAAKRGHAEALEYALDYLVFRADSLILTDPQRAMDVYDAAMAANAEIDLYDSLIQSLLLS